MRRGLLPALLFLAGCAQGVVEQRGQVAADQVGALMNAAYRGDTDSVLSLLDKGVDVNARDKSGNWSALLYAAPQGHLATVEALLTRGADAKAGGPGGQTALHTAASKGHLRIVETLLAHGADADAHDGWGQTPLNLAESSGHKDVAAALRKAGGTKGIPLTTPPINLTRSINDPRVLITDAQYADPKLGLEKGDELVSIEGESVSQMEWATLNHKLQGPYGSRVTVTIRKQGTGETRDVTLTRGGTQKGTSPESQQQQWWQEK